MTLHPAPANFLTDCECCDFSCLGCLLPSHAKAIFVNATPYIGPMSAGARNCVQQVWDDYLNGTDIICPKDYDTVDTCRWTNQGVMENYGCAGMSGCNPVGSVPYTCTVYVKFWSANDPPFFEVQVNITFLACFGTVMYGGQWYGQNWKAGSPPIIPPEALYGGGDICEELEYCLNNTVARADYGTTIYGTGIYNTVLIE